MAAENELGRHAAVCATDDRRPGRLASGDVAAALREIDRTKFWMAYEALIARFERGERVRGRERARRSFRRPRCRRRASGGKRDRSRRAELHQIPPADPIVAAINAHRAPP